MTTNYTDTFISVADDCPASIGTVPPARGDIPTVATLQYELISAHPYEFTSDDILFEVHALRRGLATGARAASREAFFAREQPCLRSASLAKRYGWGIHHDQRGRVALVAVESDEYRALSADEQLRQMRAMRSKRP